MPDQPTSTPPVSPEAREGSPEAKADKGAIDQNDATTRTAGNKAIDNEQRNADQLEEGNKEDRPKPREDWDDKPKDSKPPEKDEPDKKEPDEPTRDKPKTRERWD